MRCRPLVLLTALLCASVRAENPMDPIRFTLRPAETHQVIDSFGASGAWWADPIGEAWSEPDK